MRTPANAGVALVDVRPLRKTELPTMKMLILSSLHYYNAPSYRLVHFIYVFFDKKLCFSFNSLIISEVNLEIYCVIFVQLTKTFNNESNNTRF